MPNPIKTVFDFPREQWEQVEVRSKDGTWWKNEQWITWTVTSLYGLEARLVKREPRTVSGECSLNWTTLMLGTLALNIPSSSSIRYTITELIPGAESEPDWKAECERLTKRVNELVAESDHERLCAREYRSKILSLEGALSAASAAVQKLEHWKTGLESFGPIYGVPTNCRVWLEKVSE